MPAERSVLSATAPLLETGPLYRIPRTLLSASGDASVALGLARSSLEAFFELAGAKTSRSMKDLLRDQAPVQADIGNAEAHLRSGRAFLTEAVRNVRAAASAGTLTLDQRVPLRLATTHAIRLAVQVVDTVYNAAGATGLLDGSDRPALGAIAASIAHSSQAYHPEYRQLHACRHPANRLSSGPKNRRPTE